MVKHWQGVVVKLSASLHLLRWAGVSYVLYGSYGALASCGYACVGLSSQYAGTRQFDVIFLPSIGFCVGRAGD